MDFRIARWLQSETALLILVMPAISNHDAKRDQRLISNVEIETWIQEE